MAKNSIAQILAVLYLRMSTDDQEESIPSQRVELIKYAEKHGYKILREYIDEGISGDDTLRRIEFLHMREDAAKSEFSVVLCWDQDRFGRFDPLDAGHWIYPFRQAGVRLETVAQGRIDWEDLTGQLVYSVNQLGKAQFLRDLSRNTTRGLLSSAHAGTAGTGGPSPYGLGSKDGKVWIIEDEAKVVRSIFKQYLKADGSLRNIAGDLNRRKVPPPRGKIWRDSSVRTILTRRKYTGAFVYGSQNAGKYFAMRDGEVVPRRKMDKTVSAGPIVHEGKFEAIIPQKIFDRVQRKLIIRKGNTIRKQSRKYILAGLVKCGDCNGAMGGKTVSQGAIYHCRIYHQAGTAACHPNKIEEAPLVEGIVRLIQERYLSDSALARLRKALEAAQGDRKPRPGDLARLRREIEVLDGKIDQGAERVLTAPVEIVPSLYRKLEAWRTERERLQTDLNALTSRQATPSRQNGPEVEEAIEALRGLRQAFREADSADTRELLNSIVTKVDLHFHHETTDGGRERSQFSHGKIHIRPNAGEARSTDPNSPHMITKGWFYQPAPESTTTRCESLGGDSRNGRNRWTRYQSRKNSTDRQRDKNVMWIRVGRMASVLSFGAWFFVEMKLGRHFRAAPTHLGTVLRALRARGAAYQTDAAATFTVKSAAP